MRSSLIQKAAVIGAAASALALSAAHADWTTFTAGPLDSFSFTHAHHPDGRFILGKGGEVFVQDSFGGVDFTPVNNSGEVFFDPAFIAVRSADSALIGGGGFFGPSGLFAFDPATPATPIDATPLAELQNYTAVWWQHPESGREGWLITGGNAPDGSNDITYVSADGAFTGPVTHALSSFSGSLDTDAGGNVFIALADFDPAIEGQIIKFTADQIDAAVSAILAESLAPLAATDAGSVFHAAASGALAVDGGGRVWVGGWQIDYLQAHDPATGVTRRFHPFASLPPGYTAAPNFSPKAFHHDSQDHVSFLANDSFYAFGTDLIFGHAAIADLHVRSVQFAASTAAVNEGDGSATITVTITPPPDETVTIPVTTSGTATTGVDFTLETNEIVFTAGESSQTLTINLIDDATANEPDETVVITLGQPAPANHAGLGASATETFTLTIEDNDAPPAIVREQTFPDLRVGAAFTYQMLTTRGTATHWRATGLPPGLSINSDGVISGTPTAAGSFDRVVLTASNAFGSTVSIVFLLHVQPTPALAIGSFSSLVDRAGSATDGLGAQVELTTTARAAYTAKIRIGKKTASARGVLDTSDGDPAATATFKLGGVQHTLAFSIDTNDGSLNGALTDGGTLTGFRHATVSPLSGVCNFTAFQEGVIDDSLPQGASYGSINLPARGKVRVSLRLADNSAFTNSSSLGDGGELILYQALYRNPGTFSGALNITADLAQSVTGDLTWSKPAQTSGALYRNGWPAPLELDTRGGQYRPVAGASLPLDTLPSEAENAVLVLQDGGVEAFGTNPLETPLRILSAGKLVVPKPARLTLNNRNGALGGRVPLNDGTTRRTATLRGLLIPDETTTNPFDSRGCGFFILPTATKGQSRSGLLLLESNSP